MELERREALSAVKQAVRDYARDPSPGHARQVETAWRRVRQLDGVTRWRYGQASSVVNETPSAARLASHGLGR